MTLPASCGEAEEGGQGVADEFAEDIGGEVSQSQHGAGKAIGETNTIKHDDRNQEQCRHPCWTESRPRSLDKLPST